MHPAKKIARLMVSPIYIRYHKSLEISLLTGGILILCACGALSIPNVVEAVLADRLLPAFHGFLTVHHDWLDRWTPSLRLIFEVLIAICIGGSVFAKSAAARLQTGTELLQSALIAKSEAKMRRFERHVYWTLRKMQFLIRTATIRNIWRRLPRIMSLLMEIIRIVVGNSGFYWQYAWYLTVAFITGFPGGLYGLLAFVFLASVCAVKLLQIYLHAMG